MTNKSCRRALALLVGGCLLAGCGPEGAGSIKVNPKDPSVRNFKTFEDARRPKSSKDSGKSAKETSRARSDFR